MKLSKDLRPATMNALLYRSVVTRLLFDLQ